MPVLNSWKEVAGFLNRGIRTVQRWEVTQGLPIHRIGSGRKPPIFAFSVELERWLQIRGAKPGLPTAPQLRARSLDTKAVEKQRLLRNSLRHLVQCHMDLLATMQHTLRQTESRMHQSEAYFAQLGRPHRTDLHPGSISSRPSQLHNQVYRSHQ